MWFYSPVFKTVGASLSCFGLDGTDKVYGVWDKYFLGNATSCTLIIREAYQQLFKIWYFAWNAQWGKLTLWMLLQLNSTHMNYDKWGGYSVVCCVWSGSYFESCSCVWSFEAYFHSLDSQQGSWALQSGRLECIRQKDWGAYFTYTVWLNLDIWWKEKPFIITKGEKLPNIVRLCWNTVTMYSVAVHSTALHNGCLMIGVSLHWAHTS